MILLFPVIAGFFLGTLFFGGLWWTIRKGLGSPLAGLWFAGSLLVRTAVAISGIYFAAHDDWRKLLACMLGFTLARIVVARATRQEERTA